MKKEQMKEYLKEAWKEIFPESEPADDSDFFADGGDSIKAVQLTAWLMQKGVKLDMLKIFTNPILGEMADSLEEGQPMYVPEEMMTKEILQNRFGINPALFAKYAGRQKEPEKKENKQQMCTPENWQMCTPENWQMCTPENWQMCTPENWQMCTPENWQMCSPGNRQMCTPENRQMCTPGNRQMCTPGQSQMYTPGSQPFTGFGMSGAPMPMIPVMMPMMVMIPMYMPMYMPMQPGYMPMQPGYMPIQPADSQFQSRQVPKGNKKYSGRKKLLKKMAKKKLKKKLAELAEYQAREVQEPIENPNVTKIPQPYVGKPERSAFDVLIDVLSGILDGFDPTVNLFDQGFTSFNAMQTVTRCAEQGYRIQLQDLMLNPTFDSILAHMTPGKDD